MERVEELMTTNQLCCSVSKSLQDVTKKIEENNCSEIVIIDNDVEKHPVGLISEHDITTKCAAGLNPFNMNAKDIMRRIPVLINVRMPIEDCLRLLEHHKINHAPVIDEKGSYCGQIDLSDIIHTFND